MTQITIEQLSRFKPLSSFTPEALEEIRRKVVTLEARPGKVLFSGEAHRNEAHFLLEGSVGVTHAERSEQLLSAGEPDALSPLGGDTLQPITVTARTPVRYFRVGHELLDVLRPASGHEGYAVSEIDLSENEDANQLFLQIFQDYLEDKLDIPQMPEISHRVRRAVEDPDMGMVEVAKIIQVDPALVARLVRVANSPLYGGAAPASNVREAVVRLGLNVTRDLVTSFTVQNLFQTDNARLKKRILAIWHHSTMVAAVCFILARRLHISDPEHAMLAGLVHDIGGGVVLRQAANYPNLMADEQCLTRALSDLRGQVGSLVLEKWGFSEDIVTAAKESHEWFRAGTGHPDLCDLVIIAKVHALSAGTGSADAPDLDQVPAWTRLGVGEWTELHRLKILEDAKTEIAEVRRLLSG